MVVGGFLVGGLVGCFLLGGVFGFGWFCVGGDYVWPAD